MINTAHSMFVYKRGVSKYRAIISVIQWICTYISYQGILNDAQQVSSSYDKSLPGGAYLDLLFVVLLSQFGSLFIHEGFMDSMLFILPALYWLKQYLTKNSGVEDGAPLSKQDEETKRLLEERRKKRAERRRQKRG